MSSDEGQHVWSIVQFFYNGNHEEIVSINWQLIVYLISCATFGVFRHRSTSYITVLYLRWCENS